MCVGCSHFSVCRTGYGTTCMHGRLWEIGVGTGIKSYPKPSEG